MNEYFGRLRPPAPRRPRAAAAVTVMACVAVLTGCGGSSSTATAAAGSAQYTKALQYAQCMRSHGVTSFPDPDSQGQFPPVTVGGGASQQEVQSAKSACRNLQPGGSQGSAQQQQAELAQALNFSKCMRAHGIPKFPDPAIINGGIGYTMTGIDTKSPQYQSAQQSCRSLQPGKGQSSAGTRS